MSEGEPPRKRKARRAPRSRKNNNNWKRFGEMSEEERRQLEERDMRKRKTKDEKIGLSGGTCDQTGRLIAPVAPPITDEANNREREERSAMDARVAQEEHDWDLTGLVASAAAREANGKEAGEPAAATAAGTPVSGLAARHRDMEDWFGGLEDGIEAPARDTDADAAAGGRPASTSAAEAPEPLRPQSAAADRPASASAPAPAPAPAAAGGVSDGIQGSGGGMRLNLPWTGSRQPIDLGDMTREELIANIYAAVGYVTLLKSQAQGKA